MDPFHRPSRGREPSWPPPAVKVGLFGPATPRSIGGWRVPFTATREFRLLVIAGAMALSVLAVVIFEIRPLLSGRGSAPAADVLPSPAERDHVPWEGVLEAGEEGAPIGRDAGTLDVLRRMDRLGIGPPGPALSSAELIRRAASLRGETVRVEGLFLGSRAVRTGLPPGEREWVHETYLADPSGEGGFAVDLLDLPRADFRSLVRVDGVFLRTASYDARRGTSTVPFLLAREAMPLKIRVVSSLAGNVGLPVMGLAVAAVAGCIALNLAALGRRWRGAASAGSPGGRR